MSEMVMSSARFTGLFLLGPAFMPGNVKQHRKSAPFTGLQLGLPFTALRWLKPNQR
jgi:hypothetical protein